MPFFNKNDLELIEAVPGFFGQFFNSKNMTFGHYSVSAGESLHEHCHEGEEVLMMIKGKMEITLNGKTKVIGPHDVVVIPSNAPHSLRMVTDTNFIAVDHPVRDSINGKIPSS
ncbi:MAG: cupin domain-containing protein [Rhodospirillaceae bacterium]